MPGDYLSILNSSTRPNTQPAVHSDPAMDSKPVYETVALGEDHEEDLSSTEVDESLMGDEKGWNSQRRSKRRTCVEVVKSYRWMLDTFLLLIIIGLLLLLRRDWADHGFPKSSSQLGGDFTGAGPHCECSSIPLNFLGRSQLLMEHFSVDQKIVKFEQNDSFAPMDGPEWFSNQTLATWNTLMPGKAAKTCSQTCLKQEF